MVWPVMGDFELMWMSPVRVLRGKGKEKNPGGERERIVGILVGM